MPISVFSILGVVFAFAGLSTFLIATLALLPINTYNAILSSLMMREPSQEVLPVVYFSGSIIVAVTSYILFYLMTSYRKGGKTGESAPLLGGSTNTNMFSGANKSRFMNRYALAFILTDLVWAILGTIMLYFLADKKGSDGDDNSITNSMKKQLHTLWMDLFVLIGSAAAMGVSSIFFYVGKASSSTFNSNQ